MSPSVWTTPRVQVISNNQQQGVGTTCNKSKKGNMLQIKEGKVVAADGSIGSNSTSFLAYTAVQDTETLMLLECIGGEYNGYMVAICDDQLTAMERTRDYKKIIDAEPEVTFRKIMVDETLFVLQLSHIESQFVGFDVAGTAITPSRVSAKGKEAQLYVFGNLKDTLKPMSCNEL